MDDKFKEEAKLVIENYMNDEFTTHQFFQVYTMGFTISYLTWLKKYQDVGILHRTIGGYLLNHQKDLEIEFEGKTDESNNLYNNQNDIAVWRKVKK